MSAQNQAMIIDTATREGRDYMLGAMKRLSAGVPHTSREASRRCLAALLGADGMASVDRIAAGQAGRMV